MVPFEGRELKLDLVRVHVEYLASLAPQRHFACVDMVSQDGEFDDVDFFLEGDPGSMTVTETTAHKLNGQPYHVWEQDDRERWVRAPVDGAEDHLLGVVTGTDAFAFRYRATRSRPSMAAPSWS